MARSGDIINDHFSIICERTTYPTNVKISGTPNNTDGACTLIIMTQNTAIQDDTYYIYGFPKLNYNTNNTWVCGTGTNWSSTVNDPNKIEGNELNGVPVVASNNTGKIRIYIRYNYDYVYNLDFYPMISKIAPTTVDWSSIAGTLYGGYVDLINNKVYSTYLERAVPSANLASNIITTNSGLGVIVYQIGIIFGNINAIKTNGSIFCNKFKFVSWGIPTPVTQLTTPWTCYIANNRYLIFVGDTSLTDAEAWNNFYNQSYVMIYGEASSSTSFDIIIPQVFSFKGTNNIWSNANGPVEIKYWRH